MSVSQEQEVSSANIPNILKDIDEKLNNILESDGSDTDGDSEVDSSTQPLSGGLLNEEISTIAADMKDKFEKTSTMFYESSPSDENSILSLKSDETEDLKDKDLKVDLSKDELVLRAGELEKNGQHRLAVRYFLYALDAHKETLTVDQIAFCLERLGAICRYHKCDDEADRFAAAQRLIYETQLVQFDVIAKPNAKSIDPNAKLAPEVEDFMDIRVLDDIKRADQFERIARMFFEQENQDMAEMYLAKAILMRKEISKRFGVDYISQITKESVDVQKVAHEGREQYEDTLKEYYLKNNDAEKASELDDLIPLDLKAPVVKGPLELVGVDTAEREKTAKITSNEDALKNSLSALDLLDKIERKKKRQDLDSKDSAIGSKNVSLGQDALGEESDSENDFVDVEYLEQIKAKLLKRNGLNSDVKTNGMPDKDIDAALARRKSYAKKEGIVNQKREKSLHEKEEQSNLQRILKLLSAAMLLLALFVWLYPDVFFPLKRVYRSRR